MRVAQFFKLYQKPFGVFASAYLIAASLALLYCHTTDNWVIDTAFEPEDLIHGVTDGKLFETITKLNGYPLDTSKGSLWWGLINIIILLPGLSQFEKIFGTLHVFFFMGLISVVLGVIYSIVGIFASPTSSIYGIHVWNCIIWGYFIAQESKLGATVRLAPKTSFRLPVTWVPVILIIVTRCICTQVSITHWLLALALGYSLPLIKGILDILIPPSALFSYLEEKFMQGGKTGTHFHIRYYREVYVKKGKKYKSIFAESTGLPRTKKTTKTKGKLKSKSKK